MPLTPDQQNLVNSGGTLNTGDPATQQAYSDYVKANSAGGSGAISADSLASNPQPIAPVVPPQPGIPPVTPPVAPTAPVLTKPEQSVSDLTKSIQNIQNSLLGKTAYETQQSQEQGLFGSTGYLATSKDLEATFKTYQDQLSGLQNEANFVIPNKEKLAEVGGNIQAAQMGRPLTKEELLKNSIQQGTVTSNMLATKAHYDALQGNIANAQELVRQAVAVKYGPIEEKLAAQKANLEILKQDPALSAAEKQRVNDLLIQKDNEQNANEIKKQQFTDANKLSTDSLANIANFNPNGNPLYPTPQSAVAAMAEAAKTGDLAKVQEIVASTGLSKLPTGATGISYPAYVAQEMANGKTPMSIADWIVFNKNATAGQGVNPTTGEIYSTKGPGLVGLKTSGANPSGGTSKGGVGVPPTQVQQEYQAGHAISGLPAGVKSVSSVVDGAALNLFNGMQAPSEIKSRGAIGQTMLNQAGKISMALTGKPFDVAAADAAFKFREGSQYQNYTAAAPSALRNITAMAADAQKLNLSGITDFNDFRINLLARGFWPGSTEEQSAAKDILARIAQSKDDIGLLLGTGTGSDMKLALGGLIYSPTGSPKQTADLTKSIQETIMKKLGDYYVKAGVTDPARYLQNDMIKLLSGSGLQVGGQVNNGQVTKGTSGVINGKNYTYNGTGDTSDIKNWTQQ